MFGPPGHAYVYLVYGMYDCLNIVTERDGFPAALLVRAVEPVEGLELMRDARIAHRAARRKTSDPASRGSTSRRPLADPRLASGPGLVAAAFGIDVTWTGTDLCDPASPLQLEARPADDETLQIRATPRIGIPYAGEPWADLPWRLTVTGSPALSGPARLR